MDFLKYHKALKLSKLESNKLYHFQELTNIARPLLVLKDIISQINNNNNLDTMDLPIFSGAIINNKLIIHNFTNTYLELEKNTKFCYNGKNYKIISVIASTEKNEIIKTRSQVLGEGLAKIAISYYADKLEIIEIKEKIDKSLFEVLSDKYLIRNSKNLINVSKVDTYKYIINNWLDSFNKVNIKKVS